MCPSIAMSMAGSGPSWESLTMTILVRGQARATMLMCLSTRWVVVVRDLMGRDLLRALSEHRSEIKSWWQGSKHRMWEFFAVSFPLRNILCPRHSQIIKTDTDTHKHIHTHKHTHIHTYQRCLNITRPSLEKVPTLANLFILFYKNHPKKHCFHNF